MNAMNVRIQRLRKKDCRLLARHLGSDEREYLGHFREQTEGTGVFLVAWHRSFPVGRLWIRWRDGHIVRRLRKQYVPAWRKKDACRKPEFERAVLLSDSGRVTIDCLPQDLVGESRPEVPEDRSLWGQERALIVKALQNCGWNQSKAARTLGISRDNLRYRIKKYNIERS